MKLVKIEKNQIKKLERLLQLFLHDISASFPMEFDENECLYLYDSLDKYFARSEDCAYFIKLDKKIAGFILFTKIDNTNVIQEMFVLNQYKNKGIGKKVVFDIFNKYKGNWLIKALPNSELAEKFWLRTIKEYTNNNFKLEHIGNYDRAVFTFNNN